MRHSCAIGVTVLSYGSNPQQVRCMSNNGNGSGDFTVPVDVEMSAFDNLPAEVRDLLRRAHHNFSAVQAVELASRYGWPVVLSAIKSRDRQLSSHR